ncbi:unnamed protein product [Darwinula stevensoni]|uniref:Uncharacterized protein n=1 Tax=Darwinula stevensoni TaxID=69355 RepID=A0A7R9ABN8_9CRUS|nr:unnamed protein product [Darwinula stevensoni]CAG0899589.1 unnamed protein product [Darwinula stevensoni]
MAFLPPPDAASTPYGCVALCNRRLTAPLFRLRAPILTPSLCWHSQSAILTFCSLKELHSAIVMKLIAIRKQIQKREQLPMLMLVPILSPEDTQAALARVAAAEALARRSSPPPPPLPPPAWGRNLRTTISFLKLRRSPAVGNEAARVSPSPSSALFIHRLLMGVAFGDSHGTGGTPTAFDCGQAWIVLEPDFLCSSEGECADGTGFQDLHFNAIQNDIKVDVILGD